MNNLLYSELADIYTAIAEDRDFKKECQYIIELYHEKAHHTQCLRSLELFAGPAYHSACLASEGLESYAFDSSSAMKSIAKSRYGFTDEHYILGYLPEDLRQFDPSKKFHIMLIMRYSLGLLNYEQVEQLLFKAAELIAPGGIIVIELHKIPLLINHFEKLDIKTREIVLDNGSKVNCRWPAGKIIWEEESWQVKMPIKIDVMENNKSISYDTTSIETIFTASDLRRIIRTNPLLSLFVPDTEQIFTQSKLLVLRGQNDF